MERDDEEEPDLGGAFREKQRIARRPVKATMTKAPMLIPTIAPIGSFLVVVTLVVVGGPVKGLVEDRGIGTMLVFVIASAV